MAALSTGVLSPLGAYLLLVLVEAAKAEKDDNVWTDDILMV